MAQQVAQLLDDKCKVLETLSKCQKEVGTQPKMGLVSQTKTGPSQLRPVNNVFSCLSPKMSE